MKKLLTAVAVLAALVLGASRAAPAAHANPSSILVINSNVAASLTGLPAVDLTTSAGRATVAAKVPLTTLATDSANQVSSDVAGTGGVTIIVSSDDPATTMVLNGKGLTCTPACDNVATQTPDPTDRMAAWTVNNAGSFATGSAVTATQDSVQVSSAALTLVGAAHDMQLTVSRSTVQEGAASCGFAANPAAPTNAVASATYTDLNGNELVGYRPTFGTSSVTTFALANAAATGAASQLAVTSRDPAGTAIAGTEILCGKSVGSATLSATSSLGEIPGGLDNCVPSGIGCLTRTATITVTGVPAAIALTAAPAAIPCDGTSTSTVTAKVTDSAGNNVVDGTPVTFSVVALGTANPINTTTTAGEASSTITPLAGGTAGVVVQVTSGTAATAIRIDCLPIVPPLSVTHAASGPSTTTVQVVLNGAPGTSYRVDLYSNAVCDPQTPGGTFIGSFSHFTDGSGQFAANIILNAGVPAGQYLLATSTGPSNVTSPFSACTAVVPRQCTDDSVCNGYTDAQKISLGKDPFNFCPIMRADVNGDGTATILDLAAIAASYNEDVPPASSRLDQNFDGRITILDLSRAAQVYNEAVTGCP